MPSFFVFFLPTNKLGSVLIFLPSSRRSNIFGFWMFRSTFPSVTEICSCRGRAQNETLFSAKAKSLLTHDSKQSSVICTYLFAKEYDEKSVILT